jgi:hypothetical protein
MKKVLFSVVFFGVLLVGLNSASAFNLKYVSLLLPPTPTATINVTVDMGTLTCEALECRNWYCQISYVIGGTPTPIYPAQTYSLLYHVYYFTGLTVPDNTEYICVTWYYIQAGPPCDQTTNPKTCCTRFDINTTNYTINCNPCVQ